MAENEFNSASVSTASLTGGFVPFGGRRTLAGVNVDPMSALSVAAFRRCVALIANTVATLETVLARRNPKGGWQAADKLPLFDVLRYQPNDEQTAFAFKQALLWHAVGRGSGYAEINLDTGTPALRILDPTRTKPVVTAEGRLLYQFKPKFGETRFLKPGQVLHVHGPGWGGSDGYEVLEHGAETIGMAKAQGEWASSLYGNSAQPNGFLKTPEFMDEGVIKSTLRAWDEEFQGPQNAGKRGLLHGGMDYVPTSFSPVDAQLVEASNFSVAEIGRMMGVPAWLLDVDNAKMPASLEEGMKAFYMLTLLPWIQAVDHEFTVKLLTPRQRSQRLFIHHDARTLLRGDLRAMAELCKTMYQCSSLTSNEFRDFSGLGLPPLDTPNADEPFVAENNMTKLREVGKTPADPEPKAEAKSEAAPADLERAVRHFLADPIERLVGTEITAIRRQAASTRLDQWAEGFYPKQASKLAAALAPAVESARILGYALDAEEIARGVADESMSELRSLWTTHTPEELPTALEGPLDRWAAARTQAAVDRALKTGAGGRA